MFVSDDLVHCAGGRVIATGAAATGSGRPLLLPEVVLLPRTRNRPVRPISLPATDSTRRAVEPAVCLTLPF